MDARREAVLVTLLSLLLESQPLNVPDGQSSKVGEVEAREEISVETVTRRHLDDKGNLG